MSLRQRRHLANWPAWLCGELYWRHCVVISGVHDDFPEANPSVESVVWWHQREEEGIVVEDDSRSQHGVRVDCKIVQGTLFQSGGIMDNMYVPLDNMLWNKSQTKFRGITSFWH